MLSRNFLSDKSRIFFAKELVHQPSWNFPPARRFGVNTETDIVRLRDKKMEYEDEGRRG